jgi:hypothetical protein
MPDTLGTEYFVLQAHEANILGDEKTVHVVFNYLFVQKEVGWASPPSNHQVSHLIRGYFIQRRRIRYSPPRCFLPVFDQRQYNIILCPGE